MGIQKDRYFSYFSVKKDTETMVFLDEQKREYFNISNISNEHLYFWNGLCRTGKRSMPVA